MISGSLITCCGRAATATFFATMLCGVAYSQAFTETGSTTLAGISYNAFSMSAADIDNDGDLDLLIQGSLSSSPSSHAIFRNNLVESGTNTLSFTNITSSSGLSASDTAGWSAAWGDYDGDGDVDVFLGESNPGSASGDLFRNNGDNTFTNVSDSTGTNDPGFAQNVGWLDADRDGDLDLVIAMEGPQQHELYIQNADHTFTQSGQAAGLHVPYGIKGYGTAIGDVNDDGYPDLYISTCNGLGDGGNIRNNFFMNRTVEHGSVFFEDIADTNGTQYTLNSYGTEFVDFDDDGDLDLYVTGSDGNRTKIWRNNSDGTWTDVDTLTGHDLLSDTGTDLNGSRAVDYDNDGDLDLYFHNNVSGVARKLYRNDGNWQFTDVTTAEGLTDVGRGAYDSLWGDFDGDGDMDLITPTGSGQRERYFTNSSSTNGNHWLQIRLHQVGSNSTAIGAQVYVTTDLGTAQEKTRRREANTNADTFNQSDLPVHFGLGAHSDPVLVRVKWPDGSWKTMPSVPVDAYITVEKLPVDGLPSPSPTPVVTPFPTASPTPSPSLTVSPSATPSASVSPSVTETPIPTESPSPSPSEVPPTDSPTPTPSITMTITPTITILPTATETPSPTPSISPTTIPITPTITILPTATESPIPTLTSTPTPNPLSSDLWITR